MRPMPAPSSQPLLQVRGTRPSASGFAIPLPGRGEPLAGLGREMCYPYEPLTSPILLAPAVPPANGTSFRGSKPPRTDCLFPTATAADTLTYPRIRWPVGLRARGCGPGSSPRHGEGGDRAEAGRRWGWQSWGRLGGGTCFCGQNTLVPFAASPSTITSLAGLQLGLSALPPSVPGGLAAPPEGDFVTDMSGGGEGRG